MKHKIVVAPVRLFKYFGTHRRILQVVAPRNKQRIVDEGLGRQLDTKEQLLCYCHFLSSFHPTLAKSLICVLRIQSKILILHKTSIIMNVPKQRGGKREGAGRPKSGSKLYTFRASKEMAAYIDAQENKTDFFKTCIANTMAEDSRVLERFGIVYPASNVKGIRLPNFNIGIVAGFPIPLDNDERAQDIELLKMLCPNPESSYLIRVEGDSMIDAGIESGDIVIVDKSNRNPSESEVAVCEFNGEYTLKRFVKRGGYGWLVPANPNYPEIKVTTDDSFSIWGTVTYIIHRPRN